MARLLLGLALGATSVFLLDPQQGARRRALVRDKVTRTMNEGREFVDAARKDLRARAQGISAQARGWRGGPVTDDTLVERVRAKLGRYSSHPGAIAVTAVNGRVLLAGDALASEVQGVYDAVCSVRGVQYVDNNLTAHQSTQGVSALQGGSALARERFAPAQESWTPGVRLVAGGAGALLLLYALARGGFSGIGALAAGAALVGRAGANRPLAGLVSQRERQAA